MDTEALAKALFGAVLRKESPAGIISASYPYIKKPIIAFDTVFRLYGYAFSHPHPYQPWEDLSRDGFLPDTFIHDKDSLSYQETLYENGCSVYLEYGMTTEYPQICSPILHGGRLLGYVGIGAEGEHDIESLIKANDLLANALGTALAGNYQERTGAAGFGSLLLSMDISRAQAEALHAQKPAPYIVAILNSDKSDTPTLEYVKYLFGGEELVAAADVSHDRRLYLLFYGVRETGMDKVLALLKKYSSRYLLKCGISDWFADAVDIPKARLQAELANDLLKQRSRKTNIASFRERFFEIISVCAAGRYGNEVTVPPELKRLLANEKSAVDLIRTLDLYLLSGGNSSTVAEKSGLHKNTVYYRINKLRSLLGDSLDNPDGYLNLCMGVSLMKERMD